MAGSIQKRGNDSYRLVVSCGTRNGKQVMRRRTVHAKNPTEAKKLLTQFEREVEQGLVPDGRPMTFNEFVQKWLKEYAEIELERKTVFRYKEILNTRIIPSLGHLKLHQIRPLHIVEFENMLRENGIRMDKKEGGLSEKTILQHHALMSSILETAEHWQLIPYNPVKKIKPPKVAKQLPTEYNEEQITKLLEALEAAPLKYRLSVELSLATTMREGEVGGLDWEKHVDFDNSTITVLQASQYLPGQGTFTKGPKNETSNRLLSIPPSALALMKRWKAEQNEQRLKVGSLWHTENEQGEPENWVFTTWDGRLMHPYSVSKWFKKFLKDNKLPHIRYHDLRHISISYLIACGEDVLKVSKRAGHANGNTTLGIYGHLFRKRDEEVANKMEGLYRGKEERNKKLLGNLANTQRVR